MTTQTKVEVLKALQAARGDLGRAKCDFMCFSEEQMNKPWAGSRETPSQMLARYKAHADRIDAAIDEVNSL